MLAGLAPARRRLVLSVLGVGLVALVALTLALVVPRLTAADPVLADQDAPGPVLLVPGYGGSTAALQTLADRLTAEGRDATVVQVPGDGTGDLTASASVLADAATAALDRTGAATVDVVGYSAGGIITRLWLADGGAAQTRRVLMLGTPNHGTTLADLGSGLLPSECPTGCQQLTTDSTVLAGLNAGDPTPTGPTYVSVWTTADRVVTPPESAQLEGALDVRVQSVCAASTVEHGDLPRDALVQAIALAELGPGQPVELGSSDCARLSG